MTTAEKLVERLGELGRTCGTAESCTGGGIGSAITAVPGSSAVFMGGVISYDNSVKQGVLGVSPGTLAAVGAVSPETAEQMAVGARRLLKVDYAVSVTGIAGPGGGSAEKPVGLVWFGVATPQAQRPKSASSPAIAPKCAPLPSSTPFRCSSPQRNDALCHIRGRCAAQYGILSVSWTHTNHKPTQTPLRQRRTTRNAARAAAPS